MKIAWIQYDIIWLAVERNLKQIESIVLESSLDFDVLVLPEMFDTGFAMEPSELLDRNQDRVVDWMTEKATQWSCTIIGSTIYKEESNYYNRLFSISSHKMSYYNKNYLFGMGGEGRNYTAGNTTMECEIEDFIIRPLICYDLRFPEVSRHGGSVDCIIYVANWPLTRIDQWYKLLQARAIENQSFVLGVNRIGSDGNKLEYNGQSTLFSYEGKMLNSSESTEGIYISKIDKSAQDNYRSKFPFLKDMK